MPPQMMDYGMVGKYRLLRPLAQGGMAEIFLARQEGTAGFSKTVVVKRVLSHLAQHGEFIEMFLDEARLAAQLSHPNIVHIYDFGEADGAYFLAMEYLAGEDVSSILRAVRAKGQVVPSQMAALIASHTLEGLHYAHTLQDLAGNDLGIVHRDVSPSNIMVTFQGAVKLLDFGIAKAAGKVVQTEAGKVKGKFMYMSPEQARGMHIDGRSDVFALGAVMYEMVTGVRLFQRDNQLATLMAVTEEPIRPPRELRPHVPEELEAIILKALDREADKRYDSALAMREALDDFLAMRTYAPSHVQLKQFLLDIFGEEHLAERARPLGQASMTPPSGSHKVASQAKAAAASPPTTATPPPPIPKEAVQQSLADGQAAPVPAPVPAPPPPAADDLLDEETRIGEGLGSQPRAPAAPRLTAPAPAHGHAAAEADFFDDVEAALPRRSKLPVILGGTAVVAVAAVAAVMFLGHSPQAHKPVSPIHRFGAGPVKTAAAATGSGAAKTGATGGDTPGSAGSGAAAAGTDTGTATGTGAEPPATGADTGTAQAAKTPGTEPPATGTDTGTAQAAKTPGTEPPATGTGAEGAKTGTGDTVAAKTVAAAGTGDTGDTGTPDPATPPKRTHRTHRTRRTHHPHVTRTARRHAHPKTTKVASAASTAGTPPVPKQGTLAVNCIPYCHIYVDGKDTGLTSPARSIKLPAGKHTLRVVNPPSHLERYKDVHVQPGKTSVAVIHF